MPSFSFPFERSHLAQVAPEIQRLIQAAAAAAETAYAPYSQFKVGAALWLDEGRILWGANQENASFPAGICAERAALAQHQLEGPAKVKALAITYHAASEAGTAPLSPCGLCRQSILELQLHQGTAIAVYMCAPSGELLYVEDAAFLLPFHFSSAFL